ncbi:ATP-grasp domain-containing protein [Thalassoglobus sp. JC818]|uniref:ATP-grasp domain-containing protein n=1 Tax=Thalassoglobus sp. JC818 TaxID=3232136 RepID=UPI00345B2A66
MKIFVYESLCAGEFSSSENCDELSESLTVEGRAMLAGVVSDLLAVVADAQRTKIEVTCLWNANVVPPKVLSDERVRLKRVDSESELAAHFKAFCEEADITLVIAPEINQRLLELCETAGALSDRVWNCNPSAIELCSDKYTLNVELERWGIRCVPEISESERHSFSGMCVFKPRFGAGSDGIEVCSASDLQVREIDRSQFVVQPFLKGRPVSVAALFGSDGQVLMALPVAEQHLSKDGTLSYLGGRIPADGISAVHFERLLHQIAERISGLRGYVGIDCLLLENDPEPVVVEINPRLTTSYVGYRALLTNNLMRVLLEDELERPEFTADSVEFLSSGDCEVMQAAQGSRA